MRWLGLMPRNSGFENWIFNLLPSEVREIETQQNEIVGIELFPENLYTYLLEEAI